MKFTVISGDYKQVMDTKTPGLAALNAIDLWRYKKNKPTLAKITTVVNSKNEEIYLSTTTLIDATL